MSTIIVDLFCIAIITVVIVDLSGIIDSIKTGLGQWLGKNPEHIRIKPFSCSFCMTWWSGLLYLIIYKEVGLLTIAVLSLICVLTTVIADLILGLKDLLTRLTNKIK